MNKLKAVKFLVFVLTFLLVIGTLMCLTLIYRHARGENKPDTSAPSVLKLGEPTGSQISKLYANDGRLHIVVQYGGLPDRIIVLSKKKKKIEQKISIE